MLRTGIQANDHLERLSAIVDFESFKANLKVALSNPDGAKADRPSKSSLEFSCKTACLFGSIAAKKTVTVR